MCVYVCAYVRTIQLCNKHVCNKKLTKDIINIFFISYINKIQIYTHLRLVSTLICSFSVYLCDLVLENLVRGNLF